MWPLAFSWEIHTTPTRGESLGCSIFALAVERSLQKLVKRMIHVPKHTKTQNGFGNWVKHFPIFVELPHKSEMAPGAALPYPGLIRARTLLLLPQAWLASGRDSSLPPTQLAPLRLNVKASTKFGRMHDLRLGTYRNTNLASVCFRSRIKRFQIFMEIVQALEKERKNRSNDSTPQPAHLVAFGFFLGDPYHIYAWGIGGMLAFVFSSGCTNSTKFGENA